MTIFRHLTAIVTAALLGLGALPGRAATILPPAETCFSATTGISGMIGAIGSITGGSGYVTGTYTASLTGGSGSGGTATILVSGGAVTAVTIQQPGILYKTADVLSATAASIGGSGSGFSFPVLSTAINGSLAAGQVFMFIPNTTTPKQTWQDSGQTILNSEPIILDANGCALIYGSGLYRQQLFDSLGNLVWDQITADTSSNNSTFWAGISGGTPNVITVTDPGFNSTDGSIIYFQALNSNTGATTLSPSGVGPYQVVRDTTTGPVTLSGGEIGAGGVVGVLFTSSTNQFHLIDYIQSSGTAAATIVQPQGYLNLVGLAAGSGSVIQTADVTAATTVYYSPFIGNQIPIWNGSIFVQRVFPELQLALTASAHQASTIYDACIFLNSGNPVIVTGPAWSNSSAGTGARGTGAGTTQLQKLNGIWVNAVQITGTNGTNTYTIAANTCSYVGSLFIDGSAGQISAYRSYGQSRKWGPWNAYNRQPIYLKAGDGTASWTYGTNTIRPSNNSAANSLTVFSGLPEEPFYLRSVQTLQSFVNNGNTTMQVGIGWNVTNVFSGKVGRVDANLATQNGVQGDAVGVFYQVPQLGINTVSILELTSTFGVSATYFGTETNMVLSAEWRG